MDENAIYVILGAELQDKVHYGMPVKDGLYDMLGYSKQIAEIKRSYGKDATEEGEITVDNDVLRIKLTSEAFLSGLNGACPLVEDKHKNKEEQKMERNMVKMDGKIHMILVLLIALVWMVLSGMGTFAYASESVTYLDADGNTASVTDYKLLPHEDFSKWALTSGTYVVQGNVTINKDEEGRFMTNRGQYNIILKDNSTLTLSGDNAFEIVSSSVMNIYTQSTGSNAGKLVVNSTSTSQGAIYIASGCEMNIYGGVIETTGSGGFAGIQIGSWATMRIKNATVQGNKIYNDNELSIQKCLIKSSVEYNYDLSKFTIDGSTVDGAEIKEATITNSTIQNNSTVTGSTVTGSTVTGSTVNNSDINGKHVDNASDFTSIYISPDEVAVSGLDNLVYNGSERSLSAVSYNGTALTENTDYTVAYDPVTVKDAGDYKATVTFTGSYAGTAEKSFSIGPASVTLTANSGTETYDGSAKTVTGFTASVEGLTFADTVTASGSGTNVGSYDVTFSGVTVNETKDSTGNYVVTGTTTGTLTINTADSSAATVTAVSNLTYDGTTKTLVTVSGQAIGGTMQYVIGTSATIAPTEGWNAEIPTATEAGTYYVWYRVVGDANHADTDPAVVTATIYPAFGKAGFTLPSSTQTVEASAFEADALITSVDASHCASIGAKAFKDCVGLAKIRLPKDCAIDETAFTGCGTVLVYAPAGGTTETACAGILNLVFVEEAPEG